MREYFIWSLFFVLPVYVAGQHFNFNRIRVSAINSLEKGSGAKRVFYDYPIGVAGDYFPGREKFALAQPIIYRKKINNFTFETSYFYSRTDSFVRLIEYAWEGTDKSGIPRFYTIVKNNKRKLSAYFGNPGKEIPATEVKSETAIWENELVYVEQFIAPGLYRIRVLVSWK